MMILSQCYLGCFRCAQCCGEQTGTDRYLLIFVGRTSACKDKQNGAIEMLLDDKLLLAHITTWMIRNTKISI